MIIDLLRLVRGGVRFEYSISRLYQYKVYNKLVA